MTLRSRNFWICWWHTAEIQAFYSNQVELFKKVCAYYLDGFSEEEVRALYQTIPAGTFTNDKTEYMNLIDSKAKDYRNSLGNERLKSSGRTRQGRLLRGNGRKNI